MAKRNYDRIASKVGKAGEFVADRQTLKSLEFVERPVIESTRCSGKRKQRSETAPPSRKR